MNIYPSENFSEHENKFYVYAYLRNKTSKNGVVNSPFYIGKGCNRRAYSKDRLVCRPDDDDNIWILSWHMTENDALQYEMLLIYLYGRCNMMRDGKYGILHNRCDGGDITKGFKLSIEQKIIKSKKNLKSVWIKNIQLNQSKMIFEDDINNDLQNYLDNGWTFGRLMKSQKGLRYVHCENLQKELRIQPNEIQKYLDMGWIEGKLKYQGSPLKKYIWVKHIDVGITSMVQESELQNYLNDGWTLGRIKFSTM